jgi:hypothetical protein
MRPTAASVASRRTRPHRQNRGKSCHLSGTSPELRLCNAAAQRRIVSVAEIRSGQGAPSSSSCSCWKELLPDSRHKLRNAGPVFATNREIRLKQACGRCYSTRRLPSFEGPGIRIGMDVMLSDYRHWLEYDPVALAVLLGGVGFVELIVLSI